MVQGAPNIASVTITGSARIGQQLTANARAGGLPTPALTYQWERCAAAQPTNCAAIAGETGPTYQLTTADVGSRLRVTATATSTLGDDEQSSAPTDVVPAPPIPTPTPTATPTPAPTGRPPGTPPPSTGDTDDGAAPYLRPFPIVRIKGTLVPGGARINLLKVIAPAGARVDARCRGRRCHVRRRMSGGGRIRALERFLRARTRITIRVSTPGTIGKYVRVVIRNGSPPKRRDACLLPGATAPATCPPA